MNSAFTKTNLPALVAGEPGKDDRAAASSATARPVRPDPAPASQVFEAQMMGQSGQRRGLKGGQPVLDAARSAYLDAEWRGEHDRRLAPGTLRQISL